MPDTLLIVESPAKAKAIHKYLGKGFQVKASMGHIRDLPDKKLSVDIEAGFRPTFEVSPKKKAVVAEIHAAAKRASSVLLTPTPTARAKPSATTSRSF